MGFPEGIEYDHANDVYRTFWGNVIFDIILSMSIENEDKKKDFLSLNRKNPIW